MLDFERVLELLSELTLLKFFPSEPAARIALAKLVGRMAKTEEQIEWLVARTTSIRNEWPGPLVLRQIFCSKYKPADGIEAGSTADFPDGVPSEQPRIEPPSLPALPPGREVSIDRAMDESVKLLSIVRNMNHVRWPHRTPPKSAPAPINPDYKPVTQEDIDRALAELRAKKAQG